MKKLLSVLSAGLITTLLQSAASAGDRIIAYPQTNPPSQQANLGPRLARLSNGTFIRDSLGPTAVAGGVYTNLSAVPNGGMNLAVAPTNSAIGDGALYQLGQDDPLPLPQSASSTSQLSADTTPIVVNALQNVSIGGLGPIAAPATGSSIYILVEGQVQTHDTTPYLFTTFAPTGGQSSELEPSLRQDQVVYQLKYGTAAATPTKPTVDSGWIPISSVLIPAGTATITTGMITPYPAFGGFAQNGLAGSFSTLKISSVTNPGCLQNDSSGNVTSQTCTSGLGTVNGTSPVTATTTSGVATVGLSHGDYSDLTNAQTITGAKTYAANVKVGGGGNVQTSLTVSNNPSSTSYSPRLYMAQNIAGGAQYGFDSLNNQLRILYTPYNASTAQTESALGYFDNYGQYHVGTSTFGPNTNISGNLTAATVLAGGSGTFGASAAASEVGISAGFSSSYPVINNSSQGGMNLSVSANDTWGFRYFKYNTSSVLAQIAQLDTNGNFAVNGNINGQGATLPNGVISGGSTYGPTLASISGTLSATNVNVSSSLIAGGALVAGAPVSGLNNGDISASRSTNTGVIFYGSNAAHYTFFDGTNYNMPAGGLTLGGVLNATGVSAGVSGVSTTGSAVIGTAIQVGPSSGASSANYIAHGQTDTYPYDAGIYNGGDHIQRGTITLPGGTNAEYSYNFPQPFTVVPTCTATYRYNAALAPSWQVVSTYASAGTVRIYGEGSADVGFICMGY